MNSDEITARLPAPATLETVLTELRSLRVEMHANFGRVFQRLDSIEAEQSLMRREIAKKVNRGGTALNGWAGCAVAVIATILLLVGKRAFLTGLL
jgi:hypothetical protein